MGHFDGPGALKREYGVPEPLVGVHLDAERGAAEDDEPDERDDAPRSRRPVLSYAHEIRKERTTTI